MSRIGNEAALVLSCCCALVFQGCTSRSISRRDRDQPAQVAVSEGNEVSPTPAPAEVEEKEAPVVRDKEVRPRVLNESLRIPVESRTQALGMALSAAPRGKLRKRGMGFGGSATAHADMLPPAFNTEQYDHIAENGFRRVSDKPLSTFSIDVDAASYSNIRRFITGNRLPPADAVRIEECINYFTYDYPQPSGTHPFSITGEVGPCPWKKKHKLVHIGLQGQKVDIKDLPPSNLVFLLDVSGSMNSPVKLPLLKAALKLLANNLRPNDRVAIVVYAGAAGQVLPSTPGSRRGEIIAALDRLAAGGSTAGGAGIKLAYETAQRHFIEDGNNRVILATDGDFNVGASSDGELVRMIEEKREDGVFLTVLGFGTGNYKDSKMEKLADKGNGNYAYIDNILEAKKVLVSEMGGTLLTIAKDVKIQVEFNPAVVQAYRLIGYENRALRDEDFNDDTRDAGELGAGHTVTALYEIVPTGVKADIPTIDSLKYQRVKTVKRGANRDEMLTVKFRYKKPDGDGSKLITKVIEDVDGGRVSDNFTFSAAVAAFGMLLRDSEYKGDMTWEKVRTMAVRSRGKDREGYRLEFSRLVEQAGLLASTQTSALQTP